ncbi:MAG: hypothetical protein EBU04_08980, partial [Verrucomicrobia bacterium]|nr:hypothetical protein [Verrucomicrobiota bacterium]
MRAAFALLLVLLCGACRAASALPEVDLAPTMRPSAMVVAGVEGILIRGNTTLAEGAKVRLRVTTSQGTTYEATSVAQAGVFAARFPADFQPPAKLVPAVLYVDATGAVEFGGPQAKLSQSEITLFVSVGGIRPELPLVFMDDFTDGQGKKDAESAQWNRNRTLANLFMRSRGAALMRIQKPSFDLAAPADWQWFKNSATLYSRIEVGSALRA